MRAPGRWMLPLVALLLGAGCTDGMTDSEREATAQGRAYTAMFFGRDFDQLWARFSPEMKLTFPTAQELARYAENLSREVDVFLSDVKAA